MRAQIAVEQSVCYKMEGAKQGARCKEIGSFAHASEEVWFWSDFGPRLQEELGKFGNGFVEVLE